MGLDSSSNSSSFPKFICTICFESLNPIIDDLQSISICGHVFHEICLHQRFEHCPAGKKTRCPVCKQHCSQKNVTRLYFQSVPSEPTQPNLSRKTCLSDQPDVEASRAEIVNLQRQLSVLNQAFERQQQYLEALNQELSIVKEHAEKEKATKLALLKEKAVIQQLLQERTEELTNLTTECSILQERSMALTKELSTHKLVTDLDLDEAVLLRLASVGYEPNSDGVIDVLKKLLILLNRSYKELMSQCYLLGSGESCSVKKLEKAVKKIEKLKTRLQGLEKALEEKDKEASSAEVRSVKKLEKAVKKINKLKIRLQEAEKALEDKDKEALTASKLSTRIRMEGVCPSDLKPSSNCAPMHNIIDVERKTDDDCFIIDAASAAAASSPNMHESSVMDKNLGKRRRKDQNELTLSEAFSGDMIAVGSDGWACRIKKLRTQ